MTNNLKIHSPWSQLAIFLGLLGLSLVVGVIGSSAIVLAKAGLSSGAPDLNAPALVGVKKLAQAFSTVVIFGLPALLYARQTFRRKPLRELGFRPASETLFYALGIVLLVGAFPLEGWLGTLNKHIPLPDKLVTMEKDNDRQVVAFLEVHTPWDIIINLFVVALLPAIFEELCFRGALQRILIQIFKNPWTGIIVAGALFSAFHMQFQGFLPRMMLGILLGAAYWYSNSLWTSIIAHFFFNGIQVLAASYYPKLMDGDPSVPLTAGLMGLLAVVAILMMMRRRSTVSYEQVYHSEHNDFPAN